jgi:hypothetical protein
MSGFSSRDLATLQCSYSFACLFCLPGPGNSAEPFVLLNFRFCLPGPGNTAVQLFFCMSAFSYQNLATLQCSYPFAGPGFLPRTLQHCNGVILLHVQLCMPGLGNSVVQLFLCVSVFCNSSFPD